ncbi:hypothetical protein [Aurantiacibacter spongiae]|uniref:Secreted protein n=1 Tax=Aurantiacibacter spongiae TaxID=2488860 RepID=A0A3N5CQK9_9SPHN|nr:hypothetical protein [Aurantiacibacter spongiae]RPF71353.1 hypothetical protein EG799_06805 [Aurantiacibacter spongiae]
MTRHLFLTAATALTGLAGLAAAAPAAAQDQPGDRINQVIIYGDDECPQSTDDTITVCARMDESERYRIPERLRQSDSPQNEAWAARARSLETIGEFGPLSCTPVGAGGDLGCTVEMIEAAYQERAQGSDVRFSQLIAEARNERLAEIDAEAAATQARVEELEDAELARRRAAQERPVGDETVDPAAPPAEIVDPSRIPPQDLPPPSFEGDEDDGPRPLDAIPPAQSPQ